jgi:hypothetical protein
MAQSLERLTARSTCGLCALTATEVACIHAGSRRLASAKELASLAVSVH